MCLSKQKHVWLVFGCAAPRICSLTDKTTILYLNLTLASYLYVFLLRMSDTIRILLITCATVELDSVSTH